VSESEDEAGGLAPKAKAPPPRYESKERRMSSRDRSPRAGRDENQAELFAPAREPRTAGSSPTKAPLAEEAPRAPLPSRIRIGTSGYSFADWVGPFYPPGTSRGAMLDYYKRHFDTVEVNATYYRLPPPATMRRMAERTPPEFRFMVKLPGDVTHKRDRDPGPVAAFLQTIEPLSAAGKFAGALAQFPTSFHRSGGAEEYLDWLRGSFPEMPLFVEFRHASWASPEVVAALEERTLGVCSVDEPDLPGLIPRWAVKTGDTAYVRLHGRNAKAWWQGGGERYDYLYDRAELADWAATIRELAEGARRTYVFFNNCHAGHAVVNARMMEEILRGG